MLGARALLPATSPVVLDLPLLRPRAGSTPPPVDLKGRWDGATQEGVLEWDASTAKDVEHIEVRGCLDSWEADREETVETLGPKVTVLRTKWGLLGPGRASFKAYVMTRDGHENGGHSVTITHPEPVEE